MTSNNFFKKDLIFFLKGFTISSLLYNFLIETIPKLDIDIQALEKHIHHKITFVPDGERVSLIKVYKLWKGIEYISNRSDIGILIADYFTTKKAGVAGEIFMDTPNLKESILIMQRFMSLIIDNIVTRYEEINDEVIFYFDFIPRFLIPFSAVECYTKICYNWVVEYLKRSNIPAKQISYYGTRPKHIQYYKTNFPKIEVLFNQQENFIVLKKDIFYKDNPHKIPDWHLHYILKYAENIKNNFSKILTIKQKVTNEILMEIPKGKCSIEQIAENLNISISSLRRKLKSENITFRILLEETKKKLSISMLKDKNLTYEDISYLLGYSQYSPFFRAFKKWYHYTPSAYRKKILSLEENQNV